MLDSWPRYGFSKARGYVPIAEDRVGDLYCVCCRGPERGRVFHLAFGGEETLVFADLGEFLGQMIHDGGAAFGSTRPSSSRAEAQDRGEGTEKCGT
jgi:hypothetical protein